MANIRPSTARWNATANTDSCVACRAPLNYVIADPERQADLTLDVLAARCPRCDAPLLLFNRPIRRGVG